MTGPEKVTIPVERKRSTSKSPALSSTLAGEPTPRVLRPAMLTPVAASSFEDMEVMRLVTADCSRRDCVDILRDVGVVVSREEKKSCNKNFVTPDTKIKATGTI